MIYFINEGIQENKSGIEHAQIKRLRLFSKHHQMAKIVTRQWNPNLHNVTSASGIDDSHLSNMFDYYQGATELDAKPMKINNLDFGLEGIHYQAQKPGQLYYAYGLNNRFIARINCDGSNGFSSKVLSTEMFDGFGNLYAVNNYDSRGFKSMVDWYSPDNKIERHEWLKLDGSPVIQEFIKPDLNGKLISVGFWLRDLQGHEYNFDNIDQLFAKYLNDLNSEDHNIFVLDRSLVAEEALTKLKRPAYVAYHLHNSQAANAQDEMHSILNENYEYGLNNIDQYSAVISSTPEQTRDVKKRFKPLKAHLFTIPVGIVPDDQLRAPRIPMSKRTPDKVIIVARISYEKQMPKIVKAINKVHQKVPGVTFDIWGYKNSDKDKQAIIDEAKRDGIQNLVQFKGYTTNVGSVYDKAQIFTLASTMEGFNLAIMEAISHGVVGVTYDTNYGPNSIIQDGKNGFVVPYNDVDAMAERITELLQNPEKLQKLSTGAYDSAQRYSSENVWKQWENLLKDAQKQLG